MTNTTTTTNLPALRNGTTVRLPDGTTAKAYRDLRVGYVWDGTYYTVQNIGGVTRRDDGWRRDFLTAL